MSGLRSDLTVKIYRWHVETAVDRLDKRVGERRVAVRESTEARAKQRGRVAGVRADTRVGRPRVGGWGGSVSRGCNDAVPASECS